MQNEESNNNDHRTPTQAMRYILNHNAQAFEMAYNKDQDKNTYFLDRHGYHSLVSLIAETDDFVWMEKENI